MLKKMLFRGTVMVLSLISAEAVIEKFEKSSNKRNAKKTINLESTVEEEITEEDVQEALATELKIVK